MCIIRVIFDKIKSNQIQFKLILNFNQIYSHINLNKILNPTKSEPFDSPVILPGLKTFISSERSGM